MRHGLHDEKVYDNEKVYDVSGTPPQHLVGVSKANKKLTFVLKRNISVY